MYIYANIYVYMRIHKHIFTYIPYICLCIHSIFIDIDRYINIYTHTFTYKYKNVFWVMLMIECAHCLLWPVFTLIRAVVSEEVSCIPQRAVRLTRRLMVLFWPKEKIQIIQSGYLSVPNCLWFIHIQIHRFTSSLQFYQPLVFSA